MRVAFFTDSFYPRKDGVTTYLMVTVKRLSELGHKVLVVAPKYKNSPSEDEMSDMFGVDVSLLPSIPGVVYPDFRVGLPTPRSMMVVKRFDPDIVHFHTPGIVGSEALLISKLLKVPLVSTFHTYFTDPEWFELFGIRSESRVSDILSSALWKFAERFHKPCDLIIAPTEFVRRDLESRWKDEWIEVVYGGVEVERFRDRSYREVLRKKYGVDDGFVVLWVGRLSQDKSLDVLLTVFSKLHDVNPSVRLVMIGDGPMRKDLELYSHALGVYDVVRFLGAIDYGDIVDKNYYSMGDVFVTPSVSDTQGLSVVEAMSAGLPVVAFDVNAMPEVIGDGGVVVGVDKPLDMVDAISEIIGGVEYRERLSRNASEIAKKFSVDKSVKKLLRLYDKVLSLRKKEL